MAIHSGRHHDTSLAPPPSTIAAALLNDIHTTASATTTNRLAILPHAEQHAHHDDLPAIMAAVSARESLIATLSDAERLRHKHALIYIFTRAVLERVGRRGADEPFADHNALLRQAEDALEVLISTVREYPEVLSVVDSVSEGDANTGAGVTVGLRTIKEPLWLWLMPRLLVLLGRRDCTPLRPSLQRFFVCAYDSMSCTPKLWGVGWTFLQYLRMCLETLVSAVRASSHAPTKRRVSICLPRKDADLNAFSYLEQDATSTTTHSISLWTLHEISEARMQVLQLHALVLELLATSLGLVGEVPSLQQYISWFWGSLQSCKDMIVTGQAQLHDRSQDDIVVAGMLRELLIILTDDRLQLPAYLVGMGFSTLSAICGYIISQEGHIVPGSGHYLPTTVCECLLQLAAVGRYDTSIASSVRLHIIGPWATAKNSTGHVVGSQAEHDDLRKALLLLQWHSASASQDEHPSFEFVHLGLADKVIQLRLADLDHAGPRSPSSKRRRAEEPSASRAYSASHLADDLRSCLELEGPQDIKKIITMFPAKLAEMEVDDASNALNHLGRLACAYDGRGTACPDGTSVTSDMQCCVCDVNSGRLEVSGNQASGKVFNVAMSAIHDILILLTDLPSLAASKRLRIQAMLALRHLIMHCTEKEGFLCLMASKLGQWCLQACKSSVRELRIAAGRTLPGFLRMTGDTYATNRNIIIGILHSLSEQGAMHLQETCVLAWGQLGRVLKDEDLNPVLLKLVQYLSHANPIIAGAAYNEILKLARMTDKPLDNAVERLFSPYWNNVAIVAVKDLLIRPQVVQSMADLLETTVPQFLVLTQAHTLPWLVLWKQKDVIQRIVKARNDDEAWLTCMDPNNMTAILALLVQQPTSDMNAFVLSLLNGVSKRFEEQKLDISDLLKVEPAMIALHLLRTAGMAENDKKSRILAGLAQTSSREKDPSRQGNVQSFLEEHVLGLVARASEAVNDSREERAMLDRRSSVKAMEEMIILGQKSIRNARPQSALDQKGLQTAAFAAWACLLKYLEDDDVELMLESTFSVAIQHWSSFDETTQGRVQDVLLSLIKDRARLIRMNISNLPSLAAIPGLGKVESKLNDLRRQTDVGNAFQIYQRRLTHENSSVVTQVLTELKEFLRTHQVYLQSSAISEQPDSVVSTLVRSILDACIKFNGSDHAIARLSAECLGMVGCLDPNRIESVRKQQDMVVVGNFEAPGETIDFVVFMLKEVIVKAFLSANDTTVQGFLSFVMQELLDRAQFKDVCVPVLREGKKPTDASIYRRWLSLPESVQMTLTPFLTSRYSLSEMTKPVAKYPIFPPEKSSSGRAYNKWLRTFVLDMLIRPGNANAKVIFAPLCRAIRIKDLSVANFLLPYVVLHVTILGTDEDRAHISAELQTVIGHSTLDSQDIQTEDAQLCVEAVFRILDYMSLWMQERHVLNARVPLTSEVEDGLQRVGAMLQCLDAELISRRAVECKSYARALYNWEQHIRNLRVGQAQRSEPKLLEQLQEIYTQIDEPDGIEGLSAHLHVLDIDQQILGHRKAGRWTAAQTWYEIQLAETPDNIDVQVNLLSCLKESGQHDVLLNYVEGMHAQTSGMGDLLPFAVEAAWATGRWHTLQRCLEQAPPSLTVDFNISIGRALLALHEKDMQGFSEIIQQLQYQIGAGYSKSTTSSFAAARNSMLKLHVLSELDLIAGTGTRSSQGSQDPQTHEEKPVVLQALDRRLEVIGGFLNDKQYLLGIRRAAMQLSSDVFTKDDIAAAWLTSARLARKGNATHQSFNAVLHALKLGDESATIEQARLLWKDESQEGNRRKAIQILEGAIASNAFVLHNRSMNETGLTDVDKTQQQNLLTARAHLLLAKWLDSAGQTQSNAIRDQYQKAAVTYSTWEKGHYYLGRHYNKLFESEKMAPMDQHSDSAITWYFLPFIIQEYLRALSYGTKYIYQTLPRILTLWLDLGVQVKQAVNEKYANNKDARAEITNKRQKHLDDIHGKIHRYTAKLPAYIFYTALPQIVARITHPNPTVYQYLKQIIIKVVSAHPQHAMWSLLAMSTSMQADRKNHGVELIAILRDMKNTRSMAAPLDYKTIIANGTKLADQLLMVCNNGEFHGHRTHRCRVKDLGFNPKHCTPSLLAVPIESVLTATLPTLTDNVKTHQAFSRDVVTIAGFEDEVLVLSSLAKPKKLTALGSDGRRYGLLCKPKDDLRKDQRLMEFNSMINRSLKRDAESSRRQLYIKTYAVTPLNEECGLIEWVDGLKTLRDILLGLYKARNISINYTEIAACCEEALKGPEKLPWFTEKVLGQFPPVFHLWFVQQFPDPSAWFAARLRYTRSAAVMSMVGTILGLGDRHGENILFQEGNGGTFHVDFNCLFDKGLTFTKPERVPFRLTHNMVDAMGIYGYEGPFRKSSELTLKLLRQHQATLMTILEAFVHDPTLDLMKKQKKQRGGAATDTAQEVLDGVERKLRGLLAGESVPLSVEGQVQELIKQATDPTFLAGMYIGWCNFL